MKTTINNPFTTSGYTSPEYFCDRKNETALLLNAISSKRHVTLISIRRMGKTGLLRHVKYTLEHTKKAPVIVYVDLMPTMNGNAMLNTLASALLREKQQDKNVFEKLMTLFSRLRPKMTFDELSGQPSIQFTVETPADIQYGFDHLMKFLSDSKKEMVFMLDEFQQIGRYPEKNMEEMLRTVIQAYPTVPFIFSGSSKHMLEQMFGSAGRPFYQSSEMLYIDRIDPAEYKPFIQYHFSQSKRTIAPEAIDKILEWTRMHTFYIQYVDLLFGINQPVIDPETTLLTFGRILTSYEPLFANYRNLLPSHQYNLLQAIAVEDGIDKPTSGSFVHNHRLTGASSVNTSMKALADKEMIVFTDNKWQVYDVFFSRWLEYHYK